MSKYVHVHLEYYKGGVLFGHNMAPDGGAVFSRNSKVLFDNKSKVMLIIIQQRTRVGEYSLMPAEYI